MNRKQRKHSWESLPCPVVLVFTPIGQNEPFEQLWEVSESSPLASLHAVDGPEESWSEICAVLLREEQHRTQSPEAMGAKAALKLPLCPPQPGVVPL